MEENQFPNHHPSENVHRSSASFCTYGNFMPSKLLMTNQLWAIGYVRSRTDRFQSGVYIKTQVRI